MTILLREAIGDRLRHARTTRSRTLRDVSRAARVSLGYLSEVERGRKEASSELLASICEALDLPLSELLHTVASDVSVMAEVETVHDEHTERVGHEHVDAEGRRLASSVPGEFTDLRLAAPLGSGLPTTSVDVERAKSGAFVAA